MLHKVHIPFVNPFVLNRLRRGETFIAGIAVDVKTVEVDGDRYSLTNPTVALVVGEQVYLRLYGGFFYIETAQDHEQQIWQKLAAKWSNKPEEER